MPTQFTQIGQIVGAHGLKGRVKVVPLTDFVERFDTGSRLRLAGNWVEVESVQPQKARLLMKLSGIDDPETAKSHQWEHLEIPVDNSLPPLEDDEYRTIDLIGLTVETEDGETLGEVDNVLEFPAHDVIQVGDIMIPAVKEFVKEVDLDNKKMVVKLIEGMRPE